MVTIAMNQSDTPVKYRLIVGTKSTELSIPARAMQTVVY
jgi:hypothetical protein